MADTKTSDLDELAERPAPEDLVHIVDVSDTTMSAEGTDKKVQAQYLGGGVIGTACFDASAAEIDNLDVKGIVSEVTYDDVGSYYVIFTSSQPDENYTVAIIADPSFKVLSYTTEALVIEGFRVRIFEWDAGGTNFAPADMEKIRITIFRLAV